jgi:hypothetical protein
VLHGLTVGDQPVGAWPGNSATTRIDVQLPTREHSAFRVRRALEQRQLRLTLVGQPFVIVIEERNHIPGGRRDAEVPRTGAADAALGIDDMIREAGGRGRQFGSGFAVVDHDQFNARCGALGTNAA